MIQEQTRGWRHPPHPPTLGWGGRCTEVLVHPDPRAAHDPAWHQALIWVQEAKGGPGWTLQCWEGQGSGGRRQPGVISFLLSSPSTAWGLEELPTLSPLPSRLPLPVQTMGLDVWLPPCLRIVSSVMYIHTHAPLLGRTRQGEGTRAAGWRGFITRLLNLNLSPPGMGVLMAPEDPASQKSGNQSLHRPARHLPSLLPHSPRCFCLARPLTPLPRLQVQIWELPWGHLLSNILM